MRNRARVSNSVDVGRLASAVSRPGIDPRIWSSLAFVTAIHMDAEHGPFADVVLLPDGTQATARLGAVYAGGGFGFYVPVEVDDEVKVEAPSGDPAAGIIISTRQWSAADKPPQAAIDHPTDVLLHLKPGTTLRIIASGGGKLLLGGDASSEALVLGNVLVQALTELLTQGKLMAPLGPCTADPVWVAKYLQTAATNILSQRVLTERGP